MKLALICPPWISEPTGPLLGINLLKKYVESNSDHKVSCFDLNLSFYNQIYQDIQTDLFDFYPPHINVKIHKILKRAMELFREGGPDFFDKEKHSTAGAVFLDFFNKLYQRDYLELKRFIHGEKHNASTIDFYTELLRPTIDSKPDVVGISVMYGHQVAHALAFTKILKQKGIPTLIGGARVTSYPELFKRYLGKCCDYVIYGEGEIPLLEFCKNFNLEEKKADFSKVSNLFYLEKNTVRQTSEKIAENFNEIHNGDFSDLPLDEYFTPAKILPILTSKGCYWRKCTFCTHHSSFHLSFRVKSIKKVVEELKEYTEKDDVKYFYFVDEMISGPRFKMLAKEIIDQGLNIRWYALAKPKDFTLDIFDLMYKSGCRWILWGFESGCQRILDLMDKGTELAEIKQVLSDSKKAGINNFLYVITGFPTETELEFKETLDFLKSNSDLVDYLINSPYGLGKNSINYENIEKFGIKNVHETIIDEFNTLLKFETVSGLKRKEVKQLNKKHAKDFAAINKYPLIFTRLRDHLIYSTSENKK